jgi:signal transduction histidine kinase
MRRPGLNAGPVAAEETITTRRNITGLRNEVDTGNTGPLEVDCGVSREPGASPAGHEPAGMVEPDELPDGLVVADESAHVVVVNRVATRLLRVHRDEVLGKPLPDVLLLHDVDGHSWWDCTDPYGGLATRTGHPERSLRLDDGRELLVSARYVRAAHLGPVVRVLVSLRGAEAHERVERERADLVATVAHELRSPLTSVKGFTATLLAKWERFTDAQKRLMLETVDVDADRLTRLITELLDIARIDSGRLQLHRQVVDVEAVVRRHVARLAAGGHSPEQFRVEVPSPLPEMWLDPDKLDQVLGNLLENAVRHGQGTVTIAVEPDDGGAAVTVSDEGAGVPDELAARVFTKFWRDARRGGTGLGLYIVKGLVEAHGGSVTVGRAPSGGAAFRFTLPSVVPDFESHPA